MRHQVRVRLLLTLGILLSGLFLWIALQNVDTREIVTTLRNANLWWSLPFVASLGAFCWLKAVRWKMLLSSASPSTAGALFGPVVIGYMGTGLLPMQLGELARAFLAAHKLGLRMAATVASLVVERIFDVLALLAILGLVGTQLPERFRIVGAIFIAFAIATSSLLWLYGARTEACARVVDTVLSALPNGLRIPLIEQVRAGAAGVHAIREPTGYVALLAVTFAQWACMCACTWFSLVAVGIDPTIIAALATLATTIVSMTLPSGPGYVGTIQLAFVLALIPFGVDRSDAIAASVFYLVLLWAPLVLTGSVLLYVQGWRLRDLSDRSLMARDRSAAIRS